MKLAIFSDLHVDINGISNVKYLVSKCFKPDIDAIILAGDIANDINNFNIFVNWLCEQWQKPILFVCGNHEFYSTLVTDITVYEYIDKLKELTKNTNFNILQNDTFIHNDIKFIGATAWVNFNICQDKFSDMYSLSRYLNDFKYINFENDINNYQDICTWMINDHTKTMNFFKKELKNKSQKTVVITHHGLHKNSISSLYANERATCGYISNEESFIKKYKPDLMIHGHVHSQFNYNVNDTRIVVNPIGYINYDYTTANDPLLIEV